jgi:hypothetical protein
MAANLLAALVWIMTGSFGFGRRVLRPLKPKVLAATYRRLISR